MRYNKTNRITKVQFLPTTCRAWTNTTVTKNGKKKKKKTYDSRQWMFMDQQQKIIQITAIACQ